MKNNFWILSLCAFLLIAANIGLSVPLRVAIAANAAVIILDVIKQARRLGNAGNEKED